jgi:tRNA (mo5U34)-methyltransferase
MDFEHVKQQAVDFRGALLARKADIAPDFPWYPYDTMANVFHLDAMLTGEHRAVFGDLAGQQVADIGAADGDFGLFLDQRLGCTVDLIDNGPTNFNGLRGARRLVADVDSRTTVHEVDLDSQFALPRDHYRAVFFFGILYHLKNPFYVLEALARRAELCFVSTRIAQLTPDHNTNMKHVPVAYLLHPQEANDDSTNYWIFSEAGLLRLFDRCGWDVLDFTTVGCTTGSDPASPDRDERAFALLRRR